MVLESLSVMISKFCLRVSCLPSSFSLCSNISALPAVSHVSEMHLLTKSTLWQPRMAYTTFITLNAETYLKISPCSMFQISKRALRALSEASLGMKFLYKEGVTSFRRRGSSRDRWRPGEARICPSPLPSNASFSGCTTIHFYRYLFSGRCSNPLFYRATLPCIPCWPAEGHAARQIAYEWWWRRGLHWRHRCGYAGKTCRITGLVPNFAFPSQSWLFSQLMSLGKDPWNAGFWWLSLSSWSGCPAGKFSFACLCFLSPNTVFRELSRHLMVYGAYVA